MARQRKLKAGQAGAVAAITLAIGISPALGAHLETESATTQVPVDQAGSATAVCSEGRAVSGGFAQPDFDPTFSEAGFQFHESRREGRRGWTASAANYGSGSAGTLKAYAYCRKGAQLEERSASVTVPAPPGGGVFPSATATAECMEGETVVAGGHDISDFEIFAADAHPYASRKQGERKWTASAVNYGNTEATLTAYAYCRAGEATTRTSKSTTIGPHAHTKEVATVTAECRRGQKVVSGGFDNPDFGTLITTESQVLPYISKKKREGMWTASGFNNGDRGNPSGSGTFTVYAYCQ